jgi:cell wall-associated NlpC family hydrolase
MIKTAKTIIIYLGGLFVVLIILVIGGVLFISTAGRVSDDEKSSSSKSKTSQNQVVDVNKFVRPGITRKEIIDIALSLVGKVGYFWSGHSDKGWNPQWGTPTLITVSGDRTSGTVQPYGLDCSGYVDWVFKTAGYNGLYPPTGPQWNNTYEIKESELKPGDIVFEAPGYSQINHVGIFYKRENGVKYYIHCQGGTGVTINSSAS